MDNTKSIKAPGFGRLFVVRLIKALVVAFVLWAAATFAIQQYLRSTAAEICVDGLSFIIPMDRIYFDITDIDGLPDGFEHEKQSIEEVAQSLCSDKSPDIGEYTGTETFQIFDQRSACAVFDAESGEAVYLPDVSAFTDDEAAMLTEYKASASTLVWVTETPVHTSVDYLFPDAGGKNTMTRAIGGYINTPEGEHYVVKMVFTADYSDMLGSARLVCGIVLGVIALTAALIGARGAVKVNDRVYSDSAELSADEREQLKKRLDMPINVIIGAAEGIRTAGDDRADNIIRNANIIKDAVFGTESADEADNTDR